MKGVLARKPKDVRIVDDLEIDWKDGESTKIDFFNLRLNCPCASCVDELTGVRRITERDVRKNVRPLKSEYIGNYALRFYWNDGHHTGIYTFRSLRSNFHPA